jgi:ketosteroid isomerase-like protein
MTMSQNVRLHGGTGAIDDETHANAALLRRLFAALNQHDHATMAACYHPRATFHDIAFDLKGQPRIHGMWHMICERSNVVATIEVVDANDVEGRVSLVDTYTFSDTGYPVRNVIDSRFHFRDGLISEQTDDCDARAWASQALGPGLTGFLAGRIRLMRSLKARWKLWKFTRLYPQYR